MQYFRYPWVGILKANNPFKGLTRIVSGCFGFVRYLFASDDISVCLSMLSTETFTATMGQCKQFEIVICNCADRSLTRRLAVHVSRKKKFQWRKARWASYDTKIHMGARGTKKVEFIYDWAGNAFFVVANVRQELLSLWGGNGPEPGLHCIDAVLLDSEGRTCDRLTLLQELVP